jgi:hypothetical protein
LPTHAHIELGGRPRRRWLAWLGLVASAVFVWLAVRNVDFGVVADALGSVRYWLLGPAALALAATVLIRSLRWRAVFDPRTRPPLLPTGRALVIGLFFNSILPARAGEAARVLALARETGNPRAEVLGTVAAERVIDVFSLLVLLFVAAPFLPPVSWLGTAAVFAAALATAIVAAIAVLFVWGDRPLRALVRPLGRWVPLGRVDAAAANAVHGLAALRRPRVAVSGFALTMASWLTLACSNWLLLVAFDFGLGFGAALLVAVATNLAMVIPSSPAAVGPFEAATLVALSAYSVESSTALSYAILLHALNFVPWLLGGYVALHLHAAAVRRR